MTADTKPAASPLLRMAIDMGPLIVFFGVYAFAPVSKYERPFAATAAFMVAMVVAMSVSWWKTHHISPMLWASGALVLVMGSLTIYFHDFNFIKLKPTIVYSLFAMVLGYSLVTGKPILQAVLETAYPGLTAKGWRLLTINWTAFFVVMAILNEIVARTQTDDVWVTFKTWAVIPMTLIFAMLNIPMLMRHGLQLDKPEDAPLPPEG